MPRRQWIEQNYVINKQLPAIIFPDVEKAFDRNELEICIKDATMKKGTGTFKTWVDLLYSKPMPSVPPIYMYNNRQRNRARL